MSDARLTRIRDLIQQDVGDRGLRTDPRDNLVSRTAEDFEAACRSLASAANPAVAVLTGFYIATAQPPCGETDGPLGAVFLARALVALGFRVVLVTDPFCRQALEAGLSACGLGLAEPQQSRVQVLTIPPSGHPWKHWLELDWARYVESVGLTHLIALERVGPSHIDGRCYSMRGRDITAHTNPAHLLIEEAARRVPPLATIGIGDGGNEIGMGKVPWEVIERNIPNGRQIACRVPTDHLIVAGVSNWGAYGLAAGVRLLRGAVQDTSLFEPARERELLQVMVERGPLVDGVTGRREAAVDGLDFERYGEILPQIARILTSLEAWGR
jgi:hypothetical protein